MNLHAIAGPAVATVNPMVAVNVQIFTDMTIDDAGVRSPGYVTAIDVEAQIQALGYGDIQMIDGLQIEGERRKIYLHGRYYGLNRDEVKGGDLILYPDGAKWPYGTTWLVAMVSEQWPDWCSFIVTRQISEG